ncbi:AAA family ATPase [Singulisphaera sp. PoT]|uniref:AAA family ATPase n=1 Tax=Singulisphaera sp. PoT TaxID=3411797 RepID=UPI003BF55077
MASPIANDPWTMTVQLSDSLDEPEVRRALALLVDPDHCVQVQALPSGRWRQVPGRDLDALVQAVASLGDEAGTYLSLNPFKGPLDRATRNADVTSRRWLLIDPDAVKGVGKDASTTDEEKERARVVTEQVRDFLRSRDWPDPIFVDSGNNWQLLYRVDLPNDKLSQQLLSGCLKVIGDRFDTDGVKVDRGVHDARRICKVPGTMVRKGANSPDRPWRMARLVSVPVALAPVGVEMLKDLAGIAASKAPEPGASPSPALDPWLMSVTGGDDRIAYARSALEREIGRVATAVQPGRNGVLYEAALKLGTLVAAGLLDRGTVEQQLEAAGRACGLGRDGDDREIERAIRNGFAFGLANPRQVPERKPTPGGTKTPPKSGLESFADAKATSELQEPLFIRASSVTPKKVNWLWENRIPKGFITVFAGRTGLGKSFVTCDIVARLTAGMDWPDSEGECVTPTNVLLISEDPFEYVLTPRLIEMGADLDRVSFLSWSAMAHYQLGDTSFLDAAYAEMAPLGMVAIDPPTNFLAGKDEHKNSEVRAVLMNLVGWLNGRDTACILITHVNKSTGKGTEALSRVIGSVAWTTTSRVAHAFVPDPEVPGQAIFVPMKSNLGVLSKGISYRIAKTDTFAKVEWMGEVDMSADEAMGGDSPAKKPKASEKAGEWLKARFDEKQRWQSDELIKLGEAAGHSSDSIYAAKKAMGIKAKNTTSTTGGWTWFVDRSDTEVRKFGSSQDEVVPF